MTGEIGMTIKGNAGQLKAELASAGKAVQDFGNQAEKYLQKGEVSAKQLAFATRGLPAQFTDIVVSLQAGQNPMTVFLQQGGQIKDMFGGVGQAAKAMGGYVLGLINPYTLAAAAISTLGMAYYKGSQEAHEYTKSIVMSGNVAGVTVSQLQGMAETIHKTSGASVGAAAEALAAFARTGGIASASFEKFGATAISMEKLTGVAVADTVKQFAELGKDPVDASLKLNATTHYLTTAVYEQIRALMEQGKTLEASALAQNAFNDAMQTRIPQLKDNLGLLEKAWAGITGAAKGAWDAMLGVGRAEDPVQKIKAEIARLTNSPGYDLATADAAKQEVKELEKQLAYYEHISASNRDLAAFQKGQAKQLQDRNDFDKLHDQFLSNAEKRQLAINKATEVYLQEGNKGTPGAAQKYLSIIDGIEKQYKDVRDSADDAYLSMNAGIQKQIDSTQEELGQKSKLTEAEKFELTTLSQIALALEKKTITLEKAVALEEKMSRAVAGIVELEKQRLFNKGNDADVANKVAEEKEFAAALREQQNARNAIAIAMLATNRAIDEANGLLDIELRMTGATTRERAIAISQYQAELELKKQIELIDATHYDGGETERETVRQKARQASEKKGLLEIRKINQSEWVQIAETIQNSLTDAFMASFDSAKSLFVNLRDSVVGMFKNLVLRPIVSAVMNPIAQGMAGFMGTAGTAAAGGVAGSAGTGFLGGLSATAGGWGTGFANGLSAWGAEGSVSGMMANASLYSTAEIVGALAPIALGIVALVAISKATAGEMRSGGQYSYNPITGTQFAQGPSGGQINGPEVTTAITGTVTSINNLLASYGSASRLSGFVAGLESSGDNRGGVMAGGTLTTGGTFGQSGQGSVYAGTMYDPSKSFNMTAQEAATAFALELQQSVVKAMQASDLPAYLQKVFTSLDASTMTADQITNTLAFASSLKEVRSALLETREPLQIFKDNVAAGFATLATSADTFKTDFVAAIDAGVSPATLAAWQALATTMDQLTAATEAANVALATSKSAVLGASEKVSSVLRAIGNDVKAFADAATTAHDNLVGARLNISEALWSAQDRVIELQRQAADGLRTFAASIDDFLNTINPATSSSASLAMLKAQLSTTAVLAAGGDTGAQGQLISQAQAVLKAAEASSTDRVQYARSEAFVRSTLATVKKAVDPAPIVDAVAVAIVDPMATAKAELKAAQDAVIAYSLLAQTTGAATDRSTRLVAGSVADLATAYGVALVANTDAQANYAEALRVTSELQTTVNGTWDSLSKNLTDLDTANAAIITASGALAAELGKPNMPADELAKVLGLAGTAATNFVTRLNAALTNTSAVVPPVTAASVTTSGGTLAGVQTVTMPAAVAALVTAQSSAPGASAGQIVNAAAVNLGVSATDMVRVGTAAGDAAIVAAATAAASKMHGSGGSIAGAKDYSMAELQAVLSGESAKGFTAAQLIGAAVSGYGLTEADVRKVGKSLSLPGYAIGTNYLQKDGPIFAHAGEEITPRPFVDMQRAARDETNDLLRRLLASNAELKAEVTALKRSNEAGTKAAEKTAETLITVTRGGRAVQTEVFI